MKRDHEADLVAVPGQHDPRRALPGPGQAGDQVAHHVGAHLLGHPVELPPDQALHRLLVPGGAGGFDQFLEKGEILIVHTITLPKFKTYPQMSGSIVTDQSFAKRSRSSVTSLDFSAFFFTNSSALRRHCSNCSSLKPAPRAMFCAVAREVRSPGAWLSVLTTSRAPAARAVLAPRGRWSGRARWRVVISRRMPRSAASRRLLGGDQAGMGEDVDIGLEGRPIGPGRHRLGDRLTVADHDPRPQPRAPRGRRRRSAPGGCGSARSREGRSGPSRLPRSAATRTRRGMIRSKLEKSP